MPRLEGRKCYVHFPVSRPLKPNKIPGGKDSPNKHSNCLTLLVTSCPKYHCFTSSLPGSQQRSCFFRAATQPLRIYAPRNDSSPSNIESSTGTPMGLVSRVCGTSEIETQGSRSSPSSSDPTGRHRSYASDQRPPNNAYRQDFGRQEASTLTRSTR